MTVSRKLAVMAWSPAERTREREIRSLVRYCKELGKRRNLTADEVANALDSGAAAQLSELLLRGESTANMAQITTAFATAAKLRGEDVEVQDADVCADGPP